MGLTVATYNIHACIGTDGRFEPGRIVGGWALWRWDERRKFTPPRGN